MEKNTLYKAYLDKKKQKEKDEKTIKKYNLSSKEDTIVINSNKNRTIKLISLMFDILFRVLKIVIICGIVILVTIGATVVLNKELLNYIIEFVKV